MSLESKVVIRLLTEADTSRISSVIKVFKDTFNTVKRLDQALMHYKKTQQEAAIAADRLAKAQKAYQADAAKHAAKGLAHAASYTPTAGEKRNFEEYLSSIRGNLDALGSVAQAKGKIFKEALLTGFVKGSQGAIKALGMIKTALISLAKYAAVAAGAFLGIGIAGMISYSRLNEAMARVAIVTGYASSSIKGLQDSLLQMSSVGKFSAMQLSEAMFEIASAVNNINEADLTKVTETSGMLATAAGFHSAEVAAELLIGTYQQFGKVGVDFATDSERLAAIMANTANLTRLSLADLNVAFEFVGGTAQMLGQDFVNLTAGLGILRNAGMSASVASTSLNMVFTGLASPTEKASQWMRKLGISAVDASGKFKQLPDLAKEITAAFDQYDFKDEAQKFGALVEIFGDRGARAMTTYMNALHANSAVFDELTTAIGDTEAGYAALKKRVEEYMKTPSGFITTITNQFKNLFTVLGESVLVDEKGELRAFAKTLNEFLGSDTMKKFFTDLGNVLGRLLNAIMPSLIKLVEKLAPSIIRIVDAFAKLFESEEGQEFLDSLVELIAALAGSIADLVEQNMPLFKEFLGVLTDTLKMTKELMPVFSAIVNVFAIILKLIISVYRFVQMIILAFQMFFWLIGNVLVMVFDVILEMIQAVIDKNSQLWKDIEEVQKRMDENLRATAPQSYTEPPAPEEGGQWNEENQYSQGLGGDPEYNPDEDKFHSGFKTSNTENTTSAPIASVQNNTITINTEGSYDEEQLGEIIINKMRARGVAIGP